MLSTGTLAVLASVLAVAALVWGGFASARRQARRNAKTEAELDQSMGVLDAVKRGRDAHAKAQRAVADDPDRHLDEL